MATLKLPFEFPPNATPNSAEIQANNDALLGFISDVDAGLETLTTLVADKLKLADGTAGAPSLTFVTASTKGLYSPGTNAVALTTDSAKGLELDADGNISQPLQPSFLLYTPAAFGTSHTGDSNPFTFANEVYDIGGNVSGSIFTAPITGKYYLGCSVDVQGSGGTPATFFKINLQTSNQGFLSYWNSGSDNSVAVGVVADMDAGDTAKVIVDVATSSTTWSSEVSVLSFFTGTLIN